MVRIKVGDGEIRVTDVCKVYWRNDFEGEIDLSYKLWIRSKNILELWDNVFWRYECRELDYERDYFRILTFECTKVITLRYGVVLYIESVITKFMNWEVCHSRDKKLRNKIFLIIILLRKLDGLKRKYLETETFVRSHYTLPFSSSSKPKF